MFRKIAPLAFAFVAAFGLQACGSGSAPTATQAALGRIPSPGPLPPGAQGSLISYGRDIVHATPRFAGKFIKASMSCEACHLGAGTQTHGGSFRGIYANFPQYNKRAGHFITLQDRLAECFLYSMNGTPPAFSSREMIALTAYIAYLSNGAPVGSGFAGQGLVNFKPDRTPNISAGRTVYEQRCSACHGAGGQGNATYPPLWGPKSFNGGAGMHRLTTMSAFVRYNMPFGSPPNTLSKQQAYDVSAFVLSHPRPKFDKKRTIVFPPQEADTF
jgi:thiosulfate dehydrogenase